MVVEVVKETLERHAIEEIRDKMIEEELKKQVEMMTLEQEVMERAREEK